MEEQSQRRIGVYVDGYNLYYGGKTLVGNRSWKWLDIRKLVGTHIPKSEAWKNSKIIRIVYFTAEVTNSPETLNRQQAYLQALRVSGSVDQIVFGKFTSRKDENHAVIGSFQRFKKVQLSTDPLPDEKWFRLDKDNYVQVSHQRDEEKGSDVNLASHVLIDLLTENLDSLIVVSNDSDLAYPITYAREKVPVGLINPRGSQTAGDLRGSSSEGVGGHWWYTLTPEDFLASQLPTSVEGITKPKSW
jgi:uncharacterized LabA/DUF88 family protein